ncbi:biotin/lipoyl-binding protein, partial [Duganella sp. FT134W]
MNRRLIFVLAGAGVAVALAGAWWSGGDSGAQPPVFRPAPNPYADGLYANGIVESDQPSGANVNVYPEVAGTVRQILVREGERVRAGTPLLRLDDTVQRALSGQQQAQAQAALAQWRQLRAQPRAETLAVAQAQLDLAAANEKTASDQLAKQQRAAAIDARAVSAEALDNAA